MYDPMTFILIPNDEEKPSVLANHWRINTGLFQGDTALNTELNLYLGLKQRKDVKNVLFTTVWNQKHTMAERTGNSTGNFIAWVKEVTAKECSRKSLHRGLFPMEPPMRQPEIPHFCPISLFPCILRQIKLPCLTSSDIMR